jgi:hypothetical protein
MGSGAAKRRRRGEVAGVEIRVVMMSSRAPVGPSPWSLMSLNLDSKSFRFILFRSRFAADQVSQNLMNIGQKQGRGPGFAGGFGRQNRSGQRPGLKGQLLKTAVIEDFTVLYAKARERALQPGGDNVLIFLLGRVMPSAKQVDNKVRFALPADIKPGDLPGLAHAIIAAVSKGEVSPDEGQKMGMVLTAAASVHGQDDDTRSRLAQLEHRINLRFGPRQIEGELAGRGDNDGVANAQDR